MKALLLITITLLIITSCGYNPTGPIPPIEHKAKSFDLHIARLQTPSHTKFWTETFTKYDLKYNINWDWTELKMPDLAYSLAYSMWNAYVDGENKGACGQFASTYIVAAREHGYECGALMTYYWDPDGTNIKGHARGYIIDKYTKKVHISDNELLYKNKYRSKEHLIESFSKKWFNNPSTNGYGWICNEKLEKIIDADGTYYDAPVGHASLSIKDNAILANVLGYK